jgi:hypothetical protein
MTRQSLAVIATGNLAAGVTENLVMSDLDHDHPTAFSHPA